MQDEADRARRPFGAVFFEMPLGGNADYRARHGESVNESGEIRAMRGSVQSGW